MKKGNQFLVVKYKHLSAFFDSWLHNLVELILAINVFGEFVLYMIVSFLTIFFFRFLQAMD
jgi:hypothetical protein